MNSARWKELIDPLFNRAGCLAEQASVSARQVGVPYRKTSTYVVALKAERGKVEQLRAWKQRLEAYSVTGPTLGQLLGRTGTYFLEPTA